MFVPKLVRNPCKYSCVCSKLVYCKSNMQKVLGTDSPSHFNRKPNAGLNIYPREIVLDGDGWCRWQGSPSQRQGAWFQAPPSMAHEVRMGGGAGGITVTRPSAGIQSCRPISVLIWTQLSCRFPFHRLQHFWKSKQRPRSLAGPRLHIFTWGLARHSPVVVSGNSPRKPH